MRLLRGAREGPSGHRDVIFSSGNALGEVDEGWFDHAVEAEVLGIPVKLCAPEEMIRHKAFVMERERYDGADIAHVLRACAEQLDWPRLLVRFGPHWRLHVSQLVLFGFIHPAERSKIPQWLMERLLCRGSPLGRLPVGTHLALLQSYWEVPLEDQ